MDQIYLGWLKKWWAKYPIAVTVGYVVASAGYDVPYLLMRIAEMFA